MTAAQALHWFNIDAFFRETLEHHWTLRQLTGLLRTWSATVRYSAQHRRDPVIEVETALERLKPGAPVAILHG